MLGTLIVPAHASVKEPGAAEREGVVEGPSLPMPPGVDSMATWTWPEERRGYFLQMGVETPGLADKKGGFGAIASFDLDTGELLASVPVRPKIWGGNIGTGYSGQPDTLLLDKSVRRIYAPYNLEPADGALMGRALGASWKDGVGMSTSVDGVSQRSLCVSNAGVGGVNLPTGCVGGLLAIDADTLEVLGRVPLDTMRLDGPMVGPMLQAMALAPPRAPGDSAKVLMLLTEMAHGTNFNGNLDARGRFTAAVKYLVQFDAETLRQEWSVRIDSCRGERWYGGSQDQGYRPGGGAILRSADLSDPVIWVACTANSAVAAGVVKVPLNERGEPDPLPVAADSGPDSASGPVRPGRGQVTTLGPEMALEFLVDQPSGRILTRASDGQPKADVWWVFDTAQQRWIGTIGIGVTDHEQLSNTKSALDPATGRLYTLVADGDSAKRAAAGLYMADIRRTPLPQTLYFPEFTQFFADPASGSLRPPVVDSGAEGRPTRILVPDKDGSAKTNDIPIRRATKWLVLEDRVPVVPQEEVAGDAFEGRTLDLEEVEGVTQASLDGAARGYGAHLIFIGGLEALGRAGPIDVMNVPYTARDSTTLHNNSDLAAPPLRQTRNRYVRSPCTEVDRDVVLAFVGRNGPAVLDGNGGRGSAEPLATDTSSRADTEAPASRCTPLEWDEVWTTALFGQPPVGEPSIQWPFGDVAECTGESGGGEDRAGDQLDRFHAGVQCGDDEAGGFSYARGLDTGDLAIAESLSSFRIYRDPARGVVSRVESVARGVGLPGLLHIDTVRGSAESWANGRRWTPPQLEEGQVYNPNCDYGRTAGTCFQRHIFGLRTPRFSCGPCGDEAQLEDRFNRAFGTNTTIRLRQPDAVLARGADNGFIAAVQKPDNERFADLVLNNDLLQTVVPSLEIIRYAPSSKYDPEAPRRHRGRQVIQLAGVEVSSSYSIQCLLVYDEATNTCGAPAEPPGTIQLSLQDPEGRPLAAGAFEVRADVDADGVLGLKDTLLPNGACVTAEDGVGTCRFEGLEPGTYVVSQVAAPPGYAKNAEAFVVELASGEARTVTFTNASNVSSVELKATDENGQPLVGAGFAAYPDPDADGKVSPEAKPAAACTTDAQGACRMNVPAGSYVLVQTLAPGGLAGIEPVPFTFASGGQVAAVTVVNYPSDAPSVPDAPAPPVYTPPTGQIAPTVEVDEGYTPPADTEVMEPETAPSEGVIDQVGGTVVRVIRAPGDALRLLSRDPKQALAWTAALALFCLAALGVHRRQQAMALIRD